MKNILWIVSWYPNHYNTSSGDFIKRQAQAVSEFAKVHVLFITPVNEADAPYMEEQTVTNGNLTEQIIYYRSNESSYLGKLQSRFRYFRLGRHFIKQYIQERGLPDYVHAQIPIRAGLVALWMKKKYKLNYALTEHYGIYNREVVDPFEDRTLFYRRAVRNIIENSNPFLPVSKNVAEEINRMVVKKDYTSIPNVVNTEYFHYLPKTREGKFRFLHVSNMIPLKNVEGIIDAAKTLYTKRSDFELRIVGKHPEHIIEYATKTGLLGRCIFFTGEIPYAEVANEMHQADSFILFSRSESSSCVIQESLCCGLPVISTQVGIALEAMNERNGLFVEKNNVADLSDKMNSMMSLQTGFRREAISAEYCSLYSYEAIGKRIFESYK